MPDHCPSAFSGIMDERSPLVKGVNRIKGSIKSIIAPYIPSFISQSKPKKANALFNEVAASSGKAKRRKKTSNQNFSGDNNSPQRALRSHVSHEKRERDLSDLSDGDDDFEQFRTSKKSQAAGLCSE